MTNTLSQNLEAANLKDTNKELFSDVDLDAFQNLVVSKDDFDLMVKGFEDETTIKEIQAIKGLADVVKTFVKTKTDLASIFSNEYSMTTETDLYEVCVLGAMLTKGKVENANYQTLAKEYYESVQEKTEKKETVEKKTEAGGIFETGSAEIVYSDESGSDAREEIKEATKIENGKEITEVSIEVTAGADSRIEPLEKGKEVYKTKMEELKKLKELFTDEENKKAIQATIDDLSEKNIKEKIRDNSTGKRVWNNSEQDGNRYLIGARIAEGFIETLNKLTLKPEPKLTLQIDRENSMITRTGRVGDVAENRVLVVNIKTEIADNTGEAQVNTQAGDVSANAANNQTAGGTANQTAGGTANQTGAGSGGKVTYTNTGDKKAHGPSADYIPSASDYIPSASDIEVQEEKPGESPDIFIAERIRIAVSKDFKRNGKAIDKDKDIKKIKKTDKDNQFYLTIDDKEILFSCTKIDKDRNFDKDTKGDPKVKETDKKYYETKVESTEIIDKFKVYDVKEVSKNITATLNETKTKEAFKTYYTFKETGYSIDTKNIIITKSATGDLETIKTNIKFTLPATILANQDDKTLTEDILENVIFDKNGEIKTGSGNVFEKFVGKKQMTLLTKEKDTNDNYIKEKKNLNYYTKVSGKSITIINDELNIDESTKMADRKDNRKADVVENAENMQEIFKNYTADLTTNFKKRQINAKGGDEYELLVVPNITGVDESKYITIPFTYDQKPNTQTQYFKFKDKELVVPEKYKDEKNPKYFVIDNIYYKIDIPTGDQTSINPKIVLDYEKTKTEALKKTSTPNSNQINEAKTEKKDNNEGGRQDRNISLLNNITYNSTNYLDFSIDETDRTINYTREISLDEVLGYDQDKKNKLVLGTIKFDGKGEIIETTDRQLTVNKENQTLEIKDIFGWNKTLTIPFEIKDGKFVIGTNSNEKAKYIVEEFTKQKEYLKIRIYDDKAVITKKLNEQILAMGTQRASEFPGLALAVPKEGLWKSKNWQTIDAYKYLKGPTSNGLYYMELDNAYSGEGKNKREEEFLYFKVSGKSVTLTDMNGNSVDEIYVQSNKEYKPGKGLIQIKSDLTINTIKDVETQEKGYPEFENEPDVLKNYLTKKVDDADATHYDKEVSGKYMRVFGSSKIGHITSIPIKAEDENKNKYLYNKEGLKQITADDMAKDLRDYDNFKTLKALGGLKESELKEIFITKFKAHKDIEDATNSDNIRIKNSQGKYEYRKISSKNGETIRFEENEISKEIQEKIVDNMKKDLAIVASIENIKFKYRRSDEKKNVFNERDKAGSRTIKDLEKTTIQEFMKKEDVSEKKFTNLQILGPANETITIDLDDKIYKKLEFKDIETKGYYKDLFESQLDEGNDKEATVQKEKYKIYLQSNDKTKENRIIFESQVESAQ